MDAIDVIMQALDAATAPDVGTVSMIPDDLQDEYGTLTDMIETRLQTVGAGMLLEQYLDQPSLYDTALAEALEEAGAGEDGALIDYAQNFMRQANTRGYARGDYTADLDDEGDLDRFV
jgi:hypothetical protein